MESHWVGIEALSGIPGSLGATPIQNVGAYGQEVSQTLASVRVWDRTLKGIRTFAAADCGFGYRTSRFKSDPGRHVVLEVTFQFRQGELGAPVEYAELAQGLGVRPGERAPMAEVPPWWKPSPRHPTRVLRAAVCAGGRHSDAFPWAEVGVDDLPALAHAAGLRCIARWTAGGRWCVRCPQQRPASTTGFVVGPIGADQLQHPRVAARYGDDAQGAIHGHAVGLAHRRQAHERTRAAVGRQADHLVARRECHPQPMADRIDRHAVGPARQKDPAHELQLGCVVKTSSAPPWVSAT